MNDFFRDKQGNPLYLVGLQAHNSSTGTDMLDKAIRAVQLYGGNVLETPIYWNAIEPEMGKYDMSLVQDTIDRARAAGLYLILLWFATSKNGHPNYAPEYIKLDPATYRIAHGADGAPLPALSPHCEATLERDALAFETVMAFLKAYDGDVGTVLAVQVENEMGLGGTDRDYSEIACADYAKPLPEALLDVELADCGARDGSRTWRGHFGRHAHEAFCAWYHARYIGRIAERGRAVYGGVKLLTNVMVGEGSYEEAGHLLQQRRRRRPHDPDLEEGRPALDLLCPDIYNQEQSVYARICSLYAREDNALFIPESSPTGESNALNLLRAAVDYGAIGVCGFGAESALDNAGDLTEAAYPVMVSMRILENLAPLLIRYRGTGRIHLLLQEEFATRQLREARPLPRRGALPARRQPAPRPGLAHQPAPAGKPPPPRGARPRHPRADGRGRVLPRGRGAGAGLPAPSRSGGREPLSAPGLPPGEPAQLPLRGGGPLRGRQVGRGLPAQRRREQLLPLRARGPGRAPAPQPQHRHGPPLEARPAGRAAARAAFRLFCRFAAFCVCLQLLYICIFRKGRKIRVRTELYPNTCGMI